MLIATIADPKAIDVLEARGVKAGDAFDMEVGGVVDESAGAPVRVSGTVLAAVEGKGQLWVIVEFGRGNVLVLSRYLVQVMEPGSLSALGLDIAAFKTFVIKSRVHFRRGFDDSGFARTILLVEPVEPFLGTVAKTPEKDRRFAGCCAWTPPNAKMPRSRISGSRVATRST